MICFIAANGQTVEFTRAALEHTCLVWRAHPPASTVRVRASYAGTVAFRDLIDAMTPEARPREYACAELHAALSLAFSFRAPGVVRHVLEYVAAPREFVSVDDEKWAQRILLDADARGYTFPPALLTRLRDTIMGSPYPVLQFLWRVATYPNDAGFPAHRLSFALLNTLRAPTLKHARRVAACVLLQRRLRKHGVDVRSLGQKTDTLM